MKFMTNEDGVSPVIGVILMVAITVILAAVISVFVFGLAGDLESSAQKDVTVKTGTSENGSVTYTIFAGTDVDKITKLSWTNGTGSSDNDTVVLSIGTYGITDYPKAGEPVTFTATFSDGDSQVVATT